MVIETLTLAESVLSYLQSGANEKRSYGVTRVCFLKDSSFFLQDMNKKCTFTVTQPFILR